MKKAEGKAGLHFLVLVLSAAMILFLPEKVTAEENPEDYVTVTLHAGEYGCFGDPSVKEKESVQRAGDTFAEKTVPDALDDSYVFLGWASAPDAEMPDVFSGVTAVNSIGEDVYALWSCKAEVLYRAQEGYFEIEGTEYGEVLMSYDIGQTFNVITPTSWTDQLYFEGWYSGIGGKGTRYTAETVIDRQIITAYANWKLNLPNIPAMETDTDYPVDIERSCRMFSFTPEETTLYELYTKDVITETQAYIRVIDENRSRIIDADSVGDGNVRLSYEFEKGQTYYFEMSEFNAGPISFTVRIEKADYCTVTFHANPKSDGAAYFDGDPSVVTKEIRMKTGAVIRTVSGSGLVIADPGKYTLSGWSRDPDAEQPDRSLTADGDMTVYAVYEVFDTIVLDANGGCFTIPERTERKTMRYAPGEVFMPPFEPVTDDASCAFSGRSSGCR